MKLHSLNRSALALTLAVCTATWLSACSSTRPLPPPAAPASDAALPAGKSVAAAAPAPLAEKTVPKAAAPGDAALADGLKAYKGGQYRQAESQLKAALKAGLGTPADLATAHKHLAFIYCTSKRVGLCAAAFKNAKAADRAFALTKAEAGHPMWGRTYRKALGLK